MAKGNPKIKELGEKTRFCGESAVEAQKNSVKAHYDKKDRERIFKDELLKRMGAKDWDEAVDNFISRLKENKGDLELFLAIIGQKPADKQEIDMNANVSYEEILRRMRNGRT